MQAVFHYQLGLKNTVFLHCGAALDVLYFAFPLAIHR